VTVYSFERLSILLVEDNQYIRHTVEDLLRYFEFGKIVSAQNGQEAIEILSTSAISGAPGLGFDIVLSDLIMSPINGLLLTRWVRNAKNSPNRFMPVILLSGAADDEYVSAARDLGATEFLAKPFSAESVYKRVLEVVDYPRQIIATHTYFGPDRRRRSGTYDKASERRKNTDKDMTIVYSEKKTVKPKEESDVWCFRLPNYLKDKVGGMGSAKGGEMPMAILEKAEEKLERKKLDFADWALKYLSELSNLCADALMKPGRRSAHFEKIHLLAHELRGQGGTFGYPLITHVAKMLYEITHEHCREDDNAVEIVKAHIDTMRVVIRDRVSGDGGAIGKELIAGIQQAIDKNSTIG